MIIAWFNSRPSYVSSKMTENISGIPVVDFSAMSLKLKDPLSENGEAVKELADQVYQGFSTIGFVYLKNHGIPQEVVSVM